MFNSIDRLPPSAKSNVQVEGWLEWEILSPSGLVIAGGEQHNLILNNGLDQMMTYGPLGIASYACVGTGLAGAGATNPPAVANTALAAEVARTNDNNSIDNPIEDLGNGVFQKVFVRQFTPAQVQGQTLTEWGFSPSGAGNLCVRELFRDGQNNPITVSVGVGQTIRLIYTLQAKLATVAAQNAAFNIAGAPGNPYTGQWCSHRADPGNAERSYYAAISFPLTNGLYLAPGGPNIMSEVTYTANVTATSNFAADNSVLDAPARKRSHQLVLNTSQFNDTPMVWIVASAQGSYSEFHGGWVGFIFKFNAGKEIQKTNLQTLTIDLFSISLTRSP